MNAQALRDSSMSPSLQSKLLELNPTHPRVTHITNYLEANNNDKTDKDVLLVLWAVALLTSGFSLFNASTLRAMVKWMSLTFCVAPLRTLLPLGTGAGTWFIQGRALSPGHLKH
jgi:HSP90 family molecular chaperone